MTYLPPRSQAFCTNSHADTYDPYLHAFVKEYMEIPDGDAADPDVDCRLPLDDDERYDRRVANLNRYPHVVALYFHMKTELYVEYICKGIMGADAYWVRYEWQGRGSTHAHYFLWLKDAPDLSYLDGWVRQEVHTMFEGKDSLDEADVDNLVEALNRRAASAVCSCDASGSCSCPSPVAGCDCACHLPPTSGQVDSDVECRCGCDAARDAQWWTTLCNRWNSLWDEDEKKPQCQRVDSSTHPSKRRDPVHDGRWTETESITAPYNPTTADLELPRCYDCDVTELRNAVRSLHRPTPLGCRRPCSQCCAYQLRLVPAALR